MLAVQNSNFADLANMLIEKGSDLNARRNDGYTALHVAAANGNNTGVRYATGTRGGPVSIRGQQRANSSSGGFVQRTQIYS